MSDTEKSTVERYSGLIAGFLISGTICFALSCWAAYNAYDRYLSEQTYKQCMSRPSCVGSRSRFEMVCRCEY